MPSHQTEDAQHCQEKQNNLDNVMQPNAIRCKYMSNQTNPSSLIRSWALFLLRVQVKCRPFLRDKLRSPWHYQFIIHSLYSVSVRAQEDIHPWLCSVPDAFAKSTWNWISIDLHWHSLSSHCPWVEHRPPTCKLRAQHLLTTVHSHFLGLPFTVSSILAASSYSKASQINGAGRQSLTTYESTHVLH